MCSMGMEDDQRAIVAALLCARPRTLELAELAALDGVERVEEAVHHLREDPPRTSTARASGRRS
jgi:hypothetical protein